MPASFSGGFMAGRGSGAGYGAEGRQNSTYAPPKAETFLTSKRFLCPSKMRSLLRKSIARKRPESAGFAAKVTVPCQASDETEIDRSATPRVKFGLA
jgi:hypothetical protein